MIYILYTLFFISCLVLVVSVLLQPGKTDAGALFTSNVSSNAFGPRGTATVLSKITIVAAVVFMVSALLLAMPAITGDVSVLSTTGETTETSAPSNTNSQNSNVETNSANANVDTNASIANANESTNNVNTAGNSNASANTNISENTNSSSNK